MSREKASRLWGWVCGAVGQRVWVAGNRAQRMFVATQQELLWNTDAADGDIKAGAADEDGGARGDL